jgi:hypothetical protein
VLPESECDSERAAHQRQDGQSHDRTANRRSEWSRPREAATAFAIHTFAKRLQHTLLDAGARKHWIDLSVDPRTQIGVIDVGCHWTDSAIDSARSRSAVARWTRAFAASTEHPMVAATSSNGRST